MRNSGKFEQRNPFLYIVFANNPANYVLSLPVHHQNKKKHLSIVSANVLHCNIREGQPVRRRHFHFSL